MAGGIAAGKLNRLIEFWRYPIVIDSNGQETLGPGEFDFEAWAQVSSIRGREQTKFGREEMAMMLMIFKVRFNPRVSAKHKVKFNGIFYDIQSMSPMGRLNRELIEITAQQLDMSSIVVS